MIDGWVSVLAPGADPDPLVELVDVPMTLAGLSPLQRGERPRRRLGRAGDGHPARDRRRGAAHVPARRRAQPRPDELLLDRRVSVVIDLAHNEAGLEALLEIMNGVRRRARGCCSASASSATAGRLIEKLGEIAARDSDVVAIGAQGASTCAAGPSRSSTSCWRPGRPASGSRDPVVPDRGGGPVRPGRPGPPGDVVGLMCHAERPEVYAWIAAQGGTPDSPRTLRPRSGGRPEPRARRTWPTTRVLADGRRTAARRAGPGREAGCVGGLARAARRAHARRRRAAHGVRC